MWGFDASFCSILVWIKYLGWLDKKTLRALRKCDMFQHFLTFYGQNITLRRLRAVWLKCCEPDVIISAVLKSFTDTRPDEERPADWCGTKTKNHNREETFSHRSSEIWNSATKNKTTFISFKRRELCGLWSNQSYILFLSDFCINVLMNFDLLWI